MIFFVDRDLAGNRRLERLDDHFARVREVPNDVDFFTAELAHNRLYAGPTGADAGSDRIDFGIGADDGDLRAIARLARESLDFHGAVGDFRDLELEQATHKLGAGA